MRRKIIIGNWKMNPTSEDEALRVFRSVKNRAARLVSSHVVICPPYVYLSKFSGKAGAVALGAQNLFFEQQGAFTGQISPAMLKDLKVSHVIVGHSESRAGTPGGSLGETDGIVAGKVLAALEAGIHPVVCVGEKERDSHGLYLESLKIQIKESLSKTPKKLSGQLIMAYEPIWAVGGKEPMDPETVYETTIFIRKILSDMFGQENALKTPILYGGAINFRNAPDIIVKGKVDGLLVGRESLNVPGFTELLKAVESI